MLKPSTAKKYDLSIVSTMYLSSPYLAQFIERSCKAASQITSNFEIVLINDGSPDNSLEIAKSYLNKGIHLKIADLSRNFGHHKAMMTGLSLAQGELIFLIDCDLEEKPELLVEFHRMLKSQPDLDVVYGVRKKRDETFLKAFLGSAFYKVFNFLSDVKIPADLCVVRLMSARYQQSLMLHAEKEFVIGGLWQLTGYKQLPIPIDRTYKGQTSYNLSRQLNLSIDALVSFTTRPLKMIFVMGLVISFFALLMIIYTLAIKLMFQTTQSGFTTLSISVWLLGGLNLFAIGTLGLYMTMIYKEVKARPISIIRETFESAQ